MLIPLALLLAVAAQDAPPPPASPASMTLDQFLQRQTGRIMAADSDGDGRVSRAEMAATARGGHDPSRMFDRMDLNHDGYLDQAEIRTGLTERFRRMDANGDGIVTADERMANRPMGRGGRPGAAPAGDPGMPPPQ